MKNTPTQLLLSDDDHREWQEWFMWRQKDAVCPACFEFTSADNLRMLCANHRLCTSCHALNQKYSGKCLFCPPPAATLHLQCKCKHVFYSSKQDTIHCPACSAPVEITLSRVWKRGRAYTNFLTQKERHQIQVEFACLKAVQCPGCRQGIERKEACNELCHCGYEKVCATCGYFSFSWESGLRQHFEESPSCNDNTNIAEKRYQFLCRQGIISHT